MSIVQCFGFLRMMLNGGGGDVIDGICDECSRILSFFLFVSFV